MTTTLSITRKVQIVMLAGMVGLAASLWMVFDAVERQITSAHIDRARTITDTAMGIVTSFHRNASRWSLDEQQARILALQALRAMRYGNQEYVYVIDQNGLMLAHPRPDWQGEDVSQMRDADGVALFDLVRHHALAGDGAFSYRVARAADQPAQTKVAYAQLFKPWNWLIATGSFDDELRAAHRRVAHRFALALVPVVLCMGLGTLWISRRVAKPVRILAKLTGRIRHRDYDFDIPGGTRGDEIGLLARALTELRDGSRDAEELRRQRDLAAKVFDSSHEGIVITDPEGVALTANPAFESLSGLRACQVVGTGRRSWQSMQHGPRFHDQMWQAVERDGRWEGEIRHRHPDGSLSVVQQIVYRVTDSDGRVANHVVILRDVTESRRQQDRIQYLAYHDPLTELPNRSLLMDRLTHAISAAERSSQRLAVLFLDLDRFKMVNDSLGHDAGDLVLQHMSRQLCRTVRKSDTVARMGGDEFVVLMEGISGGEQVSSTLTRLVAALAAPVDLNGNQVHCPPSIGIALFPDDGGDPVTLLKHADAAMYAAKASGGNTFCFFSRDLTEKAAARLSLENDLRQAMALGQFRVFFQPKVCLHNGHPHGAEALIRWLHPERGVVSPVQFIPLAEETGLICDIGLWVLEETCRTIASWPPALARHLKVAVNVSAHQMTDSGFADTVLGVIERHGLSPRQVELELTESAVMHNPADTIAILGELRHRGLSIAVDDFGTGYSCLSYLKTLPIDVLKIDRAFVVNAAEHEADAEIVRTIVALARALGLSTVAEGVETPQQWAMLHQAGCDLAQGYLHGRPMAADDFLDWLRERSDDPAAEKKVRAG